MKRELHNLTVSALSGTMPCLALRGTDALAREGGDLDYMVPADSAVKACALVASAARRTGWYLIAFRDIGYLAQVVMVRPGAQGKDDAIKIDFFDGLRWYGAGTDIASQYLFSVPASAALQDPRTAGIAGFLQKTMTVGQVSDRDWQRLLDTGCDEDHLTRQAQSLGLPLTPQEIATHGATGSGKWRLRAASGGARGPISGVRWFIQAALKHAKYRLGLGTGAGMVMGISGLDGSGKSTLVDRLLSAFRKAGADVPELMHLLPSWIPMPHQLIRRKKTKNNYTKPYAEKPVSSRLNGGLRLAYYLATFGVAKVALSISILRGRKTILDRSFFDFSSDLTRARIPAYNLPASLVRLLMPPGRLFYLDASAQTVVARKGELEMDKATSLRSRYLHTCELVGATRLDGERSTDEVFTELLTCIDAEIARTLGASRSIR